MQENVKQYKVYPPQMWTDAPEKFLNMVQVHGLMDTDLAWLLAHVKTLGEKAETEALEKERDGLKQKLKWANGRNLALSIAALGVSCGAALLTLARLLLKY